MHSPPPPLCFCWFSPSPPPPLRGAGLCGPRTTTLAYPTPIDFPLSKSKTPHPPFTKNETPSPRFWFLASPPPPFTRCWIVRTPGPKSLLTLPQSTPHYPNPQSPAHRS